MMDSNIRSVDMSLVNLPPELLVMTFSYLDESQLLQISAVSKYIREIGNDHALWSESLRKRNIVPVDGNFRDATINYVQKYNFLISRILNITTLSSEDPFIAEMLIDVDAKGHSVRLAYELEKVLKRETDSETIKILIEAGASLDGILAKAIFENLSLEVINMLIEAGAQPNHYDILMALDFNVGILDVLIEAGAMKKNLEEEPDYAEIFIETALFSSGHRTTNYVLLPNTIKLLLKSGIKPTKSDLDYAIKRDFAPQVIDLLKGALSQSSS